jgi:hypothetical protein
MKMDEGGDGVGRLEEMAIQRRQRLESLKKGTTTVTGNEGDGGMVLPA